jgi:hypothetical protein
VVTHGLDFTPAISDIICVPVSNMASAGLTNIWVSTVTSTTFTISANTNATANISFAWDARLKGA